MGPRRGVASGKEGLLTTVPTPSRAPAVGGAIGRGTTSRGGTFVRCACQQNVPMLASRASRSRKNSFMKKK
jgi:hypothetical protein